MYQTPPETRSRKKVFLSLIALLIALSAVSSVLFTVFTHASTAHAASDTHQLVFKQYGKIHVALAQQGGTPPPTDTHCRTASGFPCYSPQEIRNAYNVTPLIKAGYDGKGQTIVLVDSFGSPTIASDLQTFDKGYGLPDPPSFKVLSPLGTVPFDSNNNDQIGWAFETTLDVEWAHALAPGANIVLLTSPVSETEGIQGLPEFLKLEQYAVQHKLGKIISQSWGATGQTLSDTASKNVVAQYESFYQQATTKSHVSFFASSGDSGASNVGLDGTTYYKFPTVIFPASSPYVTAVGGTSLYASTSGKYGSEVVWNDNQGGSGGGGISTLFAEPSYQTKNLSTANNTQLNGKRGIPDIAYNADPRTSILVYLSAIPNAAAYYRIGGTSEGAPQWAGLTADFNQKAGHALGFLNPALYQLGNSKNYSSVYHDITIGNNSANGVVGYHAAPGWDLTTGWGTPKAKQLADALS